MPVRAPDVVGNFFGGMQARQQHDYGQSRNALAQMEVQNAPREMAARNRLLDTQVQGAEQALGADKAKFAYTQLKQALDSGNPRQFVLQNIPDLAGKLRERNIDLASMDDQQAAQLVDGLARKYAGEAGIAPAAPAAPMSPQGRIGADVRGGYLTPEQADSALNPGMSEYQRQRLELERQKLNKPAGGAFRPMTPQEVQQAGLPAGTSAQIGPDGKIDVLSKRDNTGVLSQKDQTTAKMKLNTVSLARQQLSKVQNAFNGIKGSMSAGGFGQGKLPTPSGQAFDAAVDQMRSTLTALTRVPGVGAMSDYETKLDQSKFPARGDYESTTQQKIDGLADMLALIENGYTGLLSGDTAEQGAQPTTQQQAPAAAIEYLRANPQFRGAFKQKYGYLPDGG